MLKILFINASGSVQFDFLTAVLHSLPIGYCLFFGSRIINVTMADFNCAIILLPWTAASGKKKDGIERNILN